MIEAWMVLFAVGAWAVLESRWLTRAFLLSLDSVDPAENVRDQPKKVSVILAVRNGADEWPAFWSGMQRQKAPFPIEVVVVDDGSTDATSGLLEAALQQSDRVDHAAITVQIHRLEDSAPGKRDALRLAVSRATGDWLVFTDVDCVPVGCDWLTALLASPGTGGADVVLGVSWPSQAPPSLLHAVQALDAMTIARSYIGWANRGFPYMGVGRNLAIRKAVFPGYDHPADLASGDDDMVVQALARMEGIRFVTAIHRAAQTDTVLPASWTAWLKQKHRHWTTARHYRRADQWRLVRPKLAGFLLFVAALMVILQSPPTDGVFHNSLWIIGAIIAWVWAMEVLNFRAITRACQAPDSWHTNAWLWPMVSLWNAVVAATYVLMGSNRRDW